MENSIKIKHWVYKGDTRFFGPGRVTLLENIKATGSIVKAAKVMGMSYKKAWGMVDALNTLGRMPFVVTQKGGQQGGGAEVTEAGMAAIKAYRKLELRLLQMAEAEKELLELM